MGLKPAMPQPVSVIFRILVAGDGRKVEKADGGIGRQIFHAYILFRKNAFVQ